VPAAGGTWDGARYIQGQWHTVVNVHHYAVTLVIGGVTQSAELMRKSLHSTVFN
jgi:hypothetical protein